MLLGLSTVFPACSVPDHPPTLAACLSGVENPAYSYVTDSITGQVIDVLDAAPADCVTIAGFATLAGASTTGDWAIVIDDGARTVTAGFRVPTTTPPTLGDTVVLTTSYQDFDFAPDVGAVALRDAVGDMLAWVGSAGMVAQIPGTPVPLALGDRVGREGGACGAWAYYELLVGGISVPYGGTTTVDGLVIRHGGIRLQTSSRGRCLDWFVADALVAAHRAQ